VWGGYHARGGGARGDLNGDGNLDVFDVSPFELALADTGYANVKVIEQLQRDEAGLELYVAVGRDDNHDQRRYDYRPTTNAPMTSRRITDPTLVSMRAKLRTDEGRRLYRLRK